MSRLFLLALVMWLGWRFWRSWRVFALRRQTKEADDAAEWMVRCAYCGLNQPRSECIEKRGLFYCSEAHSTQVDPPSESAGVSKPAVDDTVDTQGRSSPRRKSSETER